MRTLKRLIAGLALTVVCGACGETIRPGKAYVAKYPALAASWKAFNPGAQYILYGENSHCGAVTWAKSRDALTSAARPSSDLPSAQRITVIAADAVSGRKDNYIAVAAKGDISGDLWLRVKPGAGLSCITTVPRQWEALATYVQKPAHFAPWLATCTEIHAQGQAPGAMLIDPDPGKALVMVDRIPAASTGYVVQMNGGTLIVPLDTFLDCFVPGQSAPPLPPSIEALLHVPQGRCRLGEAGAHLECRSTLGVWDGVVDNSHIDLKLKFRTLGPSHFNRGELVDGSRWAGAVVALSFGTTKDVKSEQVLSWVKRAVAADMGKREGGTVRLVLGDDPLATQRARVSVVGVEIGEVQHSTEEGTSKFVARQEPRPNPDRAKASSDIKGLQAAVSSAESATSNAEESITAAGSKLEEAKEEQQRKEEQVRELVRVAKEEAQRQLEKCRERAEKDYLKALCTLGQVGAEIGASMIHASEESVRQAQQELQDARATRSKAQSEIVAKREELARRKREFDSMPETILVPIMANWSYPKDVAKRTVKVLISVATQGSLEQPWHDDILPFEMNWSDYQTQADSAHNVPEHRWDEGPIKDGASLLANLSKDIEGRVAVFLAGAVANAERTQVLKRFSERGVKVRKKWEQVDAAAFDTVGSRLVDALVHNATLLGNAPLELPVAGYQVARDECMLAVAVAAEGSACPRARESAQV